MTACNVTHYIGVLNGAVFRLHDGGYSKTALPLRLDLRNHSPTGFAWGYGGSGPAQLALAILADAIVDDGRALRLYQDFKFRTVATWDRCSSWSITMAEVRRIADEIERADPERTLRAGKIR
jgi:hypothetical protein